MQKCISFFHFNMTVIYKSQVQHVFEPKNYYFRNSSRRRLIFDPLQQWLTDMRTWTENECMSILQGKSLLSEMDRTNINTVVVKGKYWGSNPCVTVVL